MHKWFYIDMGMKIVCIGHNVQAMLHISSKLCKLSHQTLYNEQVVQALTDASDQSHAYADILIAFDARMGEAKRAWRRSFFFQLKKRHRLKIEAWQLHNRLLEFESAVKSGRKEVATIYKAAKEVAVCQG